MIFFFFLFCSITTRGGFWRSLQGCSTPFYFQSTPSSFSPWALAYLLGFHKSIYSWVFLLVFSQMISSWSVFNHSIIFHPLYVPKPSQSLCLNITYNIHSTTQSI
jgi:hypothetical protein